MQDRPSRARWLPAAILAGVVALGAFRTDIARAQGTAPPLDTVVVEGQARNDEKQIVLVSGLVLHVPPSYRDVQRAIDNLYGTGQFDDVRVQQRTVAGKFVLAILVKERPLLLDYTITGVSKLPKHNIDELVRVLPKGRPIDRSGVAHARFAIDSAYKRAGYYAANVTVSESAEKAGVKLEFDVSEGNRVSISRVEIVGNDKFNTGDLVKVMETQPEGFLWFKSGKYDERTVDRDVREHLPTWYGQHGLIDMQVTKDTLIADPNTGKAILRMSLEEGEVYRVGTVSILGNRRFSSEELAALIPFVAPEQVGSGKTIGTIFDRSSWESATEKATELYQNNGYLNPNVSAEQSRRTLPDGTPVLDLRWRIQEGNPAIINKIMFAGNEVTHDAILRAAVVLLPGELFNRERLIRSFQNISNLNFFQQPLPTPDVKPSEDGSSVDITFRVEEKHTGNINFGASVGQGTGLGGFLGLEEPNLFGRGKHGRLQWQFGQNITDFQLSYTDPILFDSRVSGTITVYDSRLKYIVGDLGQQQSAGGSIQIGMPFFGSRYSRIFMNYGLQHVTYSQGSSDLQSAFRCSPCTRSTLGLSFLRDTRIGLPFPVAGNMISVNIEQNGGPIGGDANYRKLSFDSRWFAPLGTVGGKRGSIGGGIQFTLGFTAKSGFIFGNTGSFFTELYSMGGVQYGIPLRGYDEFSVTPSGFNADASSSSASQSSFGKSYAAFTTEFGARLSQAIYVDIFADAGNVYRTARQYDPSRLLRGVGIGAALISPLGPIGIDLGYGLDRTNVLGQPAPGWKVHFRLGNFF